MAQHSGVGLELHIQIFTPWVWQVQGKRSPEPYQEASTLVLRPLPLCCPAMPYAFSVFQFLQL